MSEDSSVIARLPKAVAHPFEAGFAQSMDHVFLLASGIALLGFITLLFLPKIELRKQSAMAAAAAAAQDKSNAELAADGGAARRADTAADGGVDAGSTPADETHDDVSDAVAAAIARVEARKHGEQVDHSVARHASHDE